MKAHCSSNNSKHIMSQCSYALQCITGFHRIRHYGLLANTARVQNLARARELLAAPISPLIAVPILLGGAGPPKEAAANNRTCPCCGAPMVIIETFERGHAPRAPPWPRAQAA